MLAFHCVELLREKCKWRMMASTVCCMYIYCSTTNLHSVTITIIFLSTPSSQVKQNLRCISDVQCWYRSLLVSNTQTPDTGPSYANCRAGNTWKQELVNIHFRKVILKVYQWLLTYQIENVQVHQWPNWW